MKHEGKIGFRLGSQHTSRSKAVVINQCGVITAHPVYRIRWIGNNGIERLLVTILGIEERVAQRDVKLGVIDVVQKHVHTCQVVGGVIDFLPEKAFFYQMFIKLLLGLKQQRTRTTSRVINLVYGGLSQQRKSSNQL